MALPVWEQALITVGAALIVSLVSLLYRYRQKGHPFGSLQASGWAASIVAVTAAPAALALLLPRVPPAYLGVALPTVLGIRGDRLHKQNQSSEAAVWSQVATLGVRLLLDRLVQRMEADRDEWCRRQVSRVDSLEQLEDAAMDLFSRLSNRTCMRRYLARLKSHRDAVLQAVSQAQQADLHDQFRAADRARYTAEEALTKMLQLAYDAGNADGAVIRLRASSART